MACAAGRHNGDTAAWFK